MHDAGRIRADLAKQFTESQYEKFRIVQDQEYESDFDKTVKSIKEKGELPRESVIKTKPLSDFDKKLKGLLNVPTRE